MYAQMEQFVQMDGHAIIGEGVYVPKQFVMMVLLIDVLI
jgi:hypothetical protein